MSETLTIRNVPWDLYQLVAWAQKPVWYRGYVVYPDTNEIGGVSVCAHEVWKARGDASPLMPVWDGNRLVWATAE